MSRHQDNKGKAKVSGRGTSNSPSKSYARGNAPIKKRAASSKPTEVVKKAPAKKSYSDETRLNKYIANSGICSRREAHTHIATGLVLVNGKVITEMGYKVKQGDEVRYDGAKVNPEKKNAHFPQ